MALNNDLAYKFLLKLLRGNVKKCTGTFTRNNNLIFIFYLSELNQIVKENFLGSEAMVKVILHKRTMLIEALKDNLSETSLLAKEIEEYNKQKLEDLNRQNDDDRLNMPKNLLPVERDEWENVLINRDAMPPELYTLAKIDPQQSEILKKFIKTTKPCVSPHFLIGTCYIENYPQMAEQSKQLRQDQANIQSNEEGSSSQ